ncbi:MAG: Abi family protein [Rhodobacter sp.]|nr:Abi family protein [Paracoccaceae bacterium]MCC0078083.1 Abi family protein [Rhodobacter sp.]
MVVNALSSQRFKPYLLAANFDQETALQLYFWNLRISASFYPLLGMTEIVLRNSVSDRIRAVHGQEWWDDPQFHLSIGRQAKGIVLRARKKRNEIKGRVTHGCMVAELTFGFWANMLLAKYEESYWTPIADSFPHVPAGMTFETLSRKCDRVVSLRNRIFHHEPIFKRNISEDYRDALELVSWLNPEAAAWIRPQLDIMAVLRERPRRRV